MKALLCEAFGLPSSLIVKNIDNLLPAENKIVIEVAACSANFPDTLIIQNKYQFKPNLPFSPGGEVSGVVKKIGSKVKNLKIGQRVFALCGWGGMAQEVAVDQTKVFSMPPNMDFSTAASVMYNYGTSFYALKNRAELKADQTLLVLGAAGGVGLAAVELGKIMGAKVIAAASTDEKLEVCKEKGAEYLINYSKENLKDKIKEITDGVGVDIVYDPVGDVFSEPALRSMAWGGKYLVVGFAAGEIPKIPLNLALLKGISIMGVFWGQFAAKQANENISNLLTLANWFGKGLIKSHIYKQYPLDKAANALDDLMNRKVIGKALVICNQELLAQAMETPKIIEESVLDTNKNELIKKTVFNNFDEIIAAVTKPLGESEWLQLDQERINNFADATLDHQWIHIDPEKAKMTPFGQTIAHGFLTLSLSPKFMEEIYEVKNCKMGINYGSDKIRYLKPVLSGSKIKMKATLISATLVANNGIKMIVEGAFYVQGDPSPVCVAELISILYA